jgi:hypothetical protein
MITCSQSYVSRIYYHVSICFKSENTVANLLELIPHKQANSKEDCILGYCAVWSGRSLPTFQRCLLPPSSGRWGLIASTSETSVNFYQTHGATSQKTAIFILAAVRTWNFTKPAPDQQLHVKLTVIFFWLCQGEIRLTLILYANENNLLCFPCRVSIGRSL